MGIPRRECEKKDGNSHSFTHRSFDHRLSPANHLAL